MPSNLRKNLQDFHSEEGGTDSIKKLRGNTLSEDTSKENIKILDFGRARLHSFQQFIHSSEYDLITVVAIVFLIAPVCIYAMLRNRKNNKGVFPSTKSAIQ